MTPGCLERLEEWAQKPGLRQASIRLPRAPAWLPSMPGWVAAASADRELAADACLDIARRELPPSPRHRQGISMMSPVGMLPARRGCCWLCPRCGHEHLQPAAAVCPQDRCHQTRAPATPSCLAPTSGRTLLRGHVGPLPPLPMPPGRGHMPPPRNISTHLCCPEELEPPPLRRFRPLIDSVSLCLSCTKR